MLILAFMQSKRSGNLCLVGTG